MHDLQFAALDLNLLRVFAEVYEHRSVEQAAEALALSPSATSHALRRLRDTLGDPLFTRAAGVMVPSTLAERLAPPIARRLGQLEQALAAAGTLRPLELALRWRVAGNDYIETLLMPPLSSWLSEQAPGVDLHFLPQGPGATERLKLGEADVAVGVFDKADTGPSFLQQPLIDDNFVVLMACKHPEAHRRLTLARYVAHPHVLVAPRGRPGGAIDRYLAQRGRKRRVARTVSTFSSAPYLLSDSHYLLTVGERMARHMQSQLPLVIKPLPLEVPSYTVSLLWHARTDADRTQQWLRQSLINRVADVKR